MASHLHDFTELLRQDSIPPNQRSDVSAFARSIVSMDDSNFGELLELMSGGLGSLDNSTKLSALEEIFRQMAQRFRDGDRRLSDSDRNRLESIYQSTPKDSNVRNHLLACLTQEGSPHSLAKFAELIVSDPPTNEAGIVLAFGPLFANRDLDFHLLFPALLDGMAHQHLAAAILDVANHAYRVRAFRPHPAECRHIPLNELLGKLVGSLSQIEEGNFGAQRDAAQISQTINRSVSLIVSLCDALGLIGQDASIGKLNQALSLKHRRIRTEAAAALAQMNDENGQRELLALAAEPVARKRVLAYADELGLSDRIEERFQTEQAHAESELALWLASPNQMGLPPTAIELLDTREQFWPSFDEPVSCFLFRYVYRAATGEFSGIAIVGPVTHSFNVPLDHLTVDELYAIFAGWQADHPDIYELKLDGLPPRAQVQYEQRFRQLSEHGLTDVEPEFLGQFFDESLLVATARRNGEPGTIVQSESESAWIPHGEATPAPDKSVSAELAYCAVKGKRLLAAFN